MNLKELTTRQPEEWLDAIEQCVPYDFYHLPQYHALAEDAGEGTARLFIYTEGRHVIALPLLVRSLDGMSVSAAIGAGWMDATSVYGYPGPVTSAEPIPSAVVGNFQAALLQRLRDSRVVTVFSRLNPFLAQRPLLTGLGHIRKSQTVSIDLTLPVAVQRSQYRRNFKEAINKLRRLGLTVVCDEDRTNVGDFIRIYHETMHRVEAADRYFFPASYFTKLDAALGSRLKLFMCLCEGRAVCGGLFVACHGVLQYHLGGTLNEAIPLAPMKLLLDEVRLWGSAQGLRVFHLGGGTTADPDDPLLHFKQGFSDRRHEFATWRWVVSSEQNALLRQESVRRLASQGLQPALANYFPAYRCPSVPCPGVPCDPVTSVSAASESRLEPESLYPGGTP